MLAIVRIALRRLYTFLVAALLILPPPGMDVSLTPELEKYVRRKVTSGLDNNASEVIRQALRLLVEREAAPNGQRVPQPASKHEILAKLAALEKPLRERGLTSLALFGSVVRGGCRAESDVDLLIDVAQRARFSLVDLVSVQEFLEEQLGRKVDVVTMQGLGPAIR